MFIVKVESESEFKAIIQEENPGIEINSMEVVAEDETIWTIIKLMR